MKTGQTRIIGLLALRLLGTSLRNSLAHAHDIVAYDWSAIVEMSRRLDRMLSRL